MITYCEPIFDGKNIISCDMLRINFKLDGERGLKKLIQYFDRFEYNLSSRYYQSLKSYAYRHLFVFSIVDNSFTVGLSLNGDGKLGLLKGFIEFNPNKILGFMVFSDGFMRCNNSPFLNSSEREYVLRTEMFNMFLCVYDRIMLYSHNLSIKRYDVAIDVPVFREKVQLIKDNRKYMQIYRGSSNYTEYLGNSVSGGRVKVYNKTIESVLDYDLTRIEVTCDSLEYDVFNRYMPNIYINDFELSEKNNYIFQLLDELPADRKTYYISRMSKYLRSSYKDIINQNQLQISPQVFDRLRAHIKYFIDEDFIRQFKTQRNK